MPLYHLHLRRLSKDVFYVQEYYYFCINLPPYSPFQYSAVAIVTILHDHTVSGDLTFNKSPQAQSLQNVSRSVQKFCHEFSLKDWQAPRHIQTNATFWRLNILFAELQTFSHNENIGKEYRYRNWNHSKNH